MFPNSVLNVKAVVAAFNQEKALVGAFSVIANLRMDLFEALHNTYNQTQSLTASHKSCQRAAAVEENNNYPDKLPPYQPSTVKLLILAETASFWSQKHQIKVFSTCMQF